MSEHLDLDALADLLVGEGAKDGSDSVHLAGCADCAGRLSELADAQGAVTASLAALSAPALPDDVASRITTCLASEPALTPAGGTRTATAGAGATVTPLEPRRRARRAWLPAVAASVVLLGAVPVGSSLLSDRRQDEAASTAALGAAADTSAGIARRDSELDYADPAAVSAALPGVLAGAPGTAAGREAAAPPPGSALPAPGTAAPLSSSEGSATSADQAAGDPLRRLRDPAGLASCLVALLPPEQPDVRPLALDYARYRGMPALAVVLPDPDPAKVSVFVVGPDCSRNDDDTLFFTRLARP